jgi:hypothetical protein
MSKEQSSACLVSLFVPEHGGSVFPRNVAQILLDYTASSFTTVSNSLFSTIQLLDAMQSHRQTDRCNCIRPPLITILSSDKFVTIIPTIRGPVYRCGTGSPVTSGCIANLTHTSLSSEASSCSATQGNTSSILLEPAIGSYPEPDESSPNTLFQIKIHFNIIIPSTLRSSQ